MHFPNRLLASDARREIVLATKFVDICKESRHIQISAHLGLAEIFIARSSYASAVLGIVILSVRLSVCVSVCHKRAL